MSGGAAGLLPDLPRLTTGFLLVLSRVSAAMMVLPGMGEAELPKPTRVALALAVTVLLFPLAEPLVALADDAVGTLLLALAGELAVGLWLGWLARLVMLALPQAGKFVAASLGLSNVLQPDEMMGQQTEVLSTLFRLAAPVLILAGGLHVPLLASLAGSFAVLAPGRLWGGDMLRTIVTATGASLRLALQLAAPFIVASLVWQATLGVAGRMVPRLQTWFVAIPGQILGGFLLLAMLAAAMLAAWQGAVGAAFLALPGV